MCRQTGLPTCKAVGQQRLHRCTSGRGLGPQRGPHIARLPAQTCSRSLEVCDCAVYRRPRGRGEQHTGWWKRLAHPPRQRRRRRYPPGAASAARRATTPPCPLRCSSVVAGSAGSAGRAPSVLAEPRDGIVADQQAKHAAIAPTCAICDRSARNSPPSPASPGSRAASCTGMLSGKPRLL